ncbi:hypothetical protein SLEP1_g52824 [Rubroshorea leprosula]|uniref:BCAS3 domain-containing protein n=1 Tax=Rubroshorea leprosula TaxID=152421 RepID=A0AAV5MBA3_9ROSI|nr:hypothetical protein SLEP1_g52824 [Rubroshorea leprosula]
MTKSGDGQQRTQGGGVVSRSARSSFRAISSYLRIVSSGASTAARSAVSVASSIVDRADDSGHDQVHWAGFDKLEDEVDVVRRVLLLGYRSGFQVWDIEEADNVHDLVSRHDGPVSFMQMLPKPIASKRPGDKFASSRPLLVVCTDGSFSGGTNLQDGLVTASNGSMPHYHDPGSGTFVPTVVRFYSLKSQSYVHMLKFRSLVYSVRCSSRVVAISQATQIHCLDVTTLEREYTILTNPIAVGYPGSGGIGYGPLAVGPRWLAYSGSPVAVSNFGRVSPEHLTPSASFPGFSSNGSLVAHYAKESSKQLAAGIVTLGDIGYKKLSKYYSELLPDSHNSLQSGSPGWKENGTVNGHLLDPDNIGMVIVRDIVSKVVIAQFRAHKSPISALCFDPTGMLLVTASVQGHNINVFKIMPGLQGSSDASGSFIHLYRLQRGFTNAVIQDISFSDDSSLIMISSSRGTSHLFAINPLGGSVNFQSSDPKFSPKHSAVGVTTKPQVRWPPNLGAQTPNQQRFCATGPPITLSVVSRIRNGNNGWRGTVSGAAAAATGRMGSLSGAIASSFYNCKGNSNSLGDRSSSKTKYLLVFSPSGCVIQYALQISDDHGSTPVISGLNTAYESTTESDGRLIVQAVQKWNICQKHSRREWEDNIDIYGENGTSDSNKIYPEEINAGNVYADARNTVAKEKNNIEEKHHLFISEAELQMHQAQMPLWAKPEVYFQSMVTEGIKMPEEDAFGGEIEIERFPTRMIEARSKDLIPIFDNLQTTKFLQARVPAVDRNSNGNWQLPHQSSRLSENGQLSYQSSSGSLDSMIENGATVAELHSGMEETGLDSPLMRIESNGYVNMNDSPRTKTRLENVNNTQSLQMEAHLKYLNNNNEGQKMENHFENEGDEFD